MMVAVEPTNAHVEPMTAGQRRIAILGVGIDDLTEREVLARLDAAIRSRRPHHLVTVNPEFVVEAQVNPDFRTMLARADLATADGFGILLAARYLGTPLRGRVTGVDLTWQLARLCADRGYRIFLLGAAPGVAEAAAAVLQARYPQLVIAGTYAGSPQPRHEPFLRQLIRATHPDVLLVAYGHPQQDLWIARNQSSLQVPLAAGVGGTFDYISGRVPRAPAAIRRMGMEWAYRLIRQPQRWRRIINAVPRFAWLVLRYGRQPAYQTLP
ncbi:glycosyl transferase, WecB/TagA/CpsF family [Oscillochloris trichoides DG-6]|uniref:Glycosyl transferase, WecB/TagA/CpsF family n=1 Tax=Oscillochloris trichoides DG-6 TaxID=765420 RepID=E1IFR2_9CHLR|nr:WecB/TagA/CpsF family glycosyltransferase [Oscillochloris trichoides]EFO79953.1 glycosyl transferase, WecB/TagA/CpsF family [Oscillochloris trichoides DG-6]